MYKKYFKSEGAESWFLLIVLSLIWGSSYILIKKGLQSFSPDQVGTLRISFAFLFMLPFALRNLRRVPKGKWKIIFFTGMVGNLIPALLFALAQTQIESSLSGILNALTPLFVLLIAVFIFKFRISAKQVMGIIIGFIGTIGLSFVTSSGGIGSMNIYVWLIVIATICYGLSLNFIKMYFGDMRSLVITSLAMFSVGPFALAYLLTTNFFNVLNAPGAMESLGYVALLGVIGTAIALVLYTRLIHISSPFFASSVTYLLPIVAIMWGTLDGEKLHILHFAGMSLILLGIYIVNKTENFRKQVKL